MLISEWMTDVLSIGFTHLIITMIPMGENSRPEHVVVDRKMMGHMMIRDGQKIVSPHGPLAVSWRPASGLVKIILTPIG